MVVGALVLAAPQALAQPAAKPAAEKKATSGLEEVVVTAQRRSQNIQDVPLAVTSFSSRALEVQQISNTLDIARVIPNFFAANNVGQASANVYFIRGLGQPSPSRPLNPRSAPISTTSTLVARTQITSPCSASTSCRYCVDPRHLFRS